MLLLQISFWSFINYMPIILWYILFKVILFADYFLFWLTSEAFVAFQIFKLVALFDNLQK